MRNCLLKVGSTTGLSLKDCSSKESQPAAVPPRRRCRVPSSSLAAQLATWLTAQPEAEEPRPPATWRPATRNRIPGPRSSRRARARVSARSTILARVGTAALARNRVIHENNFRHSKQHLWHALWRGSLPTKLRPALRPRSLGHLILRLLRNYRRQALHLKLRRRWARAHRDEHVARARAASGGNDEGEAILIGHDDKRRRRSEENGHSVFCADPCQRGRKGDVHSHHRIIGARAVGHSHDQRLKRLPCQHKL